MARVQADPRYPREDATRDQPVLAARLDDVQVGGHGELCALRHGCVVARCVPRRGAQSVLSQGSVTLFFFTFSSHLSLI